MESILSNVNDEQGRERFAPDSPEHKGVRIEIRCSEKTKTKAARLAKRQGVSVSELLCDLIDAEMLRGAK